MKTKKVLALLLAATMTCSLVGCGGGDAQTGGDTAEAPAAEAEPAEEEAPAESEAEAPAAEEAAGTGEASIDFEDGVFGFAGVDKSVNSAGDDSALSVEDFNGSKALKVMPQGKASYIGIQADALLGSNAASLKTVEMSIGIENPDGEFGACSGKIYAFTGADNVRSEAAWSVYLENGNPKTASIEVPEFGEGNYIVVSMETDTAKDKGATPANFYIDNIAFKDASGSVLAADTSVEYVSASTGADRSNLCALTGAVEFEGFSVSADGWAQAGATMTDAVLAALVPGSVVEITYTSDTGNMWIVMNEAEAGWMRVGVGNADGSGSDAAYINNSKNTAQVTFEQIAALCGDDVSKWGSTMQCESDGAWTVQSVKVGQKAPSYALSGAVEFEGFTVSGDGWAQAGATMTDDVLAALVPGSVVEITYSSDTGNMWIVMNEAEAGWMRVGVGDADGSGQGYAICDGSTCYIPFEMIAEYCGDDVSKWGSTMQCESDGAWEVYGVKVGKAEEFKMVKNLVPFEGFTTSADGWAQDGAAMTPEIIEALVPGSVVVITYASDTGNMWVVMNEAEAGWMRVGVGDADGSGQGYAICNGTTCQIPFEMIAEYCGDDVSKWGSTMQCESDGAWEVFSVAVGTAAE